MRARVLFVGLLGIILSACGSDQGTTPSNTGGSSTGAGGKVGNTGGTASSAGGTSAGGSSNQSGGSAPISGGTSPGTGGKVTGGSASTSGGTSTNGGKSTGGTSTTTGGSSSTQGGSAPSGGTSTATGGNASGGGSSAGGAVSAGGSSGGKADTGGASSGGSATAGGNGTGGNGTGGNAAGGSTSSGGNASGGSTNTGGAATGGTITGGAATATGGSGGSCPAFTVPAASSLTAISEMPDPFKFMSGTRMTSPSEWKCRREELSQLIQRFQYGVYPPKPDKVSGTLSGTTLTVKVEYGGKSITFSPTVTLPSGSGPFPVYIGLAGTGFGPPFAASELSSRGIVHIAYDTYDMAADSAGKGGKFYTLYGTGVTAGVLMAWGWGIHRIIDALEQISSFDATKVAVHGFSRWGKGALVTGAFDERITVTIASSSGSGGIGSWRSADARKAAGANVQTLQQINDEAPWWFTSELKSSFVGKTTRLPFDGHSVAALVAPRPLLVTEGSSDSWNNPVGCFIAATGAKKLFDYVAPANYFGFSSKNHSHAFQEQTAGLAFMDRFMLGQSTATAFFENPGGFTVSSSDIPWSAP